MLNEFLVLGRVPGTNFQITFYEMALALDICLVIYLMHRRYVFSRIVHRIVNYYWSVYILLLTEKGQQLSLRLQG